MYLEGREQPLLIDSGAEVSVLPMSVMHELFPQNTGIPVEELGTRNVQTIGESPVTLYGPKFVHVQVRGVHFLHPFYMLDGISVIVAGIDLITTAGLVIDTYNRCIWSHFSAELEINIPPVLAKEPPSLTIDNVSNFVDQQQCTPAYLRDGCLCSAQSCISANGFQTCQRQDSDDKRRDTNTCSFGANAHIFVPGARMHPGPMASSSSCVVNCPHSHSDSVCNDMTASARVNDAVMSPRDDCNLPSQPTVTVDSDLTLLKTASVSKELPEHVNVLFLQTVQDNKLDTDVTNGLKDLLYYHQDTFAKSSTDLGFCPVIQHDIDTGDSLPIKQSPRRPPLAAREAEDKILDEMLHTGVTEPSTSPWASPVCLVRKRDQSYRFCIDYRRLNAVSKRDAFPVPHIQDPLDHLRGSKYFGVCDLVNGYWQLGLTDRAKERSAFCTRRGLFQFKRMPFGLAGAPRLRFAG